VLIAMADDGYDLVIVNASELVTVTNSECQGPLTGEHMRELGVIEDGALAVSDGKIAVVGTTKEVEASIDKSKASKVI
jgi:imidazolonepropionase